MPYEMEVYTALLIEKLKEREEAAKKSGH
jgi:hypothetical protein